MSNCVFFSFTEADREVISNDITVHAWSETTLQSLATR